MDRELLTESFIRDAAKQAAIKESERLMKEMEEETVFVPPGFHDKILKLLNRAIMPIR